MGEITEAPIAATVPARIGTFDSLKIRNFRLLLVGTTLSNAGQWIQQVTLGWLIFDMTGSGTALGTINLMRSISTVGLAPFSGAVIDRFPRRNLMIATNTWLLTISLGMSAVLFAGAERPWQLYVFALLGGLAQVIDMPLRQTIVFVLVPRHLAANALALVQTAWSVMRSLGPIIGGLLILWFGAGGNFLLQATAYGLIAFNTLRIQFPPHQAPATRRPVLQNIKDGLAYVAADRVTRTFMIMGWIMPLLIIPNFMALPPIYARNVFGGGPQVLGLLLSAVGVGGILGGLFTASLGRFERRGLVQLIALVCVSLSLIGFALSRSLLAAFPLLMLAGCFENIFLTGNQTMLQLSIPDQLRGRVTSLTSLSAGLSPVGAMFAGAGSDVVGPQEVTIILSALAIAVAVLVFLFVPLVRNYRISGAIGR